MTVPEGYCRINLERKKRTKKYNDPFGFNKAINWDKLEDPEVLKELEELFEEEEKNEKN